MSGLDGILKTINEKSEEKAKSVLASYSKKAQKGSEIILQRAENECKSALESAEKEGDTIRVQAYSSAKSISSLRILELKYELISQVIEEAKKRLMSMSDDEYFSLMYRWIQSSIEDKCGEIQFNLRDNSRLPNGFIEKINSRGKGNLTLSKIPADIQGGFILRYEKISENCSLQALIEEKYDEITDSVARIFFQRGDTIE